MKKLFRYNWMVRDEWFDLCQGIPIEELLRERVGGAGSILYTLFHVIDVEYSWIRGIQGKSDIQMKFDNFKSLKQVKELSDSLRNEIQVFLKTWSNKFENEIVRVSWSNGHYMKGEILSHVIVHEIHHMGQLSIWVKELGFKPVSANVIERGLM